MNIYSELVAEQGFMTFSIQGNSMEPLLKEGDSVRIIDVVSLKPGNCYMFKLKNKLILHRLVSINAGWYYFIGDNSNHFEKVTRDQICGVLNGYTGDCLQIWLISIINRLYLLAIKMSSVCRITGLRNKIIRFIFRSFR